MNELFHCCFVLWLEDHGHVLYINYGCEQQDGAVKGRTFAGYHKKKHYTFVPNYPLQNDDMIM